MILGHVGKWIKLQCNDAVPSCTFSYVLITGKDEGDESSIWIYSWGGQLLKQYRQEALAMKRESRMLSISPSHGNLITIITCKSNELQQCTFHKYQVTITLSYNKKMSI